jgi:hypothetical protein
MDNNGANFTHTRELEDKTLSIRFGEKSSDNFMVGDIFATVLPQSGNGLVVATRLQRNMFAK